jgi:hypothetical protein
MRFSLKRIHDFFFANNEVRHLKQTIQTNKLLKGIVTLVWTTICLFHDLEREYQAENMLGHQEPEAPTMQFQKREERFDRVDS